MAQILRGGFCTSEHIQADPSQPPRNPHSYKEKEEWGRDIFGSRGSRELTDPLETPKTSSLSSHLPSASVHAKLLQSRVQLFFFPGPTFCNPMNRSLPDSSFHGILQARILEWVAMPSSRGSSRPRDQTRVSYVSCTGRWVLHHHHHLGSPSFAPFIHNFFQHPFCAIERSQKLLWSIRCACLMGSLFISEWDLS